MPCQLEFYPTCTEGSNLLLAHSCTFYKQLDFKKGIVIRLIININFLYRDFDGSEQTNEGSKISFISCNIWASIHEKPLVVYISYFLTDVLLIIKIFLTFLNA